MENYSRAHDDSNESFFHPKNLGRTNFASGWNTAGIFRYSSVCTAICKNAKESKIDKNYKILDVGCSTATFFGFFVDSYVKQDKPDISYLGLEIRESCIEKANDLFKERPDKYRNKFECRKFDAITEHISINEKYDCIILAEILEHLGQYEAQELLRQASNALSNNGIIIISSPNPDKKNGQKFVWQENHIYEFSLKEMLILCNDTHLKLDYIFGWLRRKSVKIPNNLKYEYDSLCTISEGIADSIMAHKFPMLAECYTLILKKEKN